jgi:hypothetical protein
VYSALPGREDRNEWSTVFPRLIGRAWTSTVALAFAENEVAELVPVSVALFVKVWVGGSPVPFVIWPARAVMVIVPAAGVFAGTVPVFQLTVVCVLGMIVGAPSDGDEELDT